jgi:hypothetical protein
VFGAGFGGLEGVDAAGGVFLACAIDDLDFVADVGGGGGGIAGEIGAKGVWFADGVVGAGAVANRDSAVRAWGGPILEV